jgi:hypothetical protein
MEPLFGPPDQRTTFYGQGALYRMGGQMFAPLHTVGFTRYGGVQASETTGGINYPIR